MPEKIVILDGYSLMYRAFHALQTPMTAPDGTPTNAVHGFVMMLLKVIDEERPDSLAVAFDLHAPTFRHRMYDGYKATRKPMPDELRAQDPVIRELIGLMGIPILEREGYEADDILGTVSAHCAGGGLRHARPHLPEGDLRGLQGHAQAHAGRASGPGPDHTGVAGADGHSHHRARGL